MINAREYTLINIKFTLQYYYFIKKFCDLLQHIKYSNDIGAYIQKTVLPP